jgi:hypothetical protein
MLKWKVALAVGALAVAPALALACGDDDDDDLIDDARTEVTDVIDDTRTEVSDVFDDDTPEAGGAEGGDPSVEITSLEDGDTVEAGGVEVSVDVENFDVVDKLGEPPADGEGHVHYYLDVAEVPTTPGQPAVTAEGTYHAEATESFTWEDVSPGTHTFAVQLVNNDHTPLEPPVTASVEVTVD